MFFCFFQSWQSCQRASGFEIERNRSILIFRNVCSDIQRMQFRQKEMWRVPVWMLSSLRKRLVFNHNKKMCFLPSFHMKMKRSDNREKLKWLLKRPKEHNGGRTPANTSILLCRPYYTLHYVQVHHFSLFSQDIKCLSLLYYSMCLFLATFSSLTTSSCYPSERQIIKL